MIGSITHEIKRILDEKGNEKLHIKDCTIWVYFSQYTQDYVIVTGGLNITFDNYRYSHDRLSLYRNGVYFGFVTGSSLGFA